MKHLVKCLARVSYYSVSTGIDGCGDKDWQVGGLGEDGIWSSSLWWFRLIRGLGPRWKSVLVPVNITDSLWRPLRLSIKKSVEGKGQKSRRNYREMIYNVWTF